MGSAISLTSSSKMPASIVKQMEVTRTAIDRDMVSTFVDYRLVLVL
jgi:hypothetical protein